MPSSIAAALRPYLIQPIAVGSHSEIFGKAITSAGRRQELRFASYYAISGTG